MEWFLIFIQILLEHSSDADDMLEVCLFPDSDTGSFRCCMNDLSASDVDCDMTVVADDVARLFALPAYFFSDMALRRGAVR